MNLLRLTTGLLALSLTAALIAPAGADQVFSSVSTGPVHVYPTAPPYPLGDVYYSPCGAYGNYGGTGGSGFGRGLRGRRTGNTTLTGERFYPFDISSDHNRILGRGGHGNGTFGSGMNGFRRNGYGMNCFGQGYRGRPSPGQPMPAPVRPMPVPYATP